MDNGQGLYYDRVTITWGDGTETEARMAIAYASGLEYLPFDDTGHYFNPWHAIKELRLHYASRAPVE